jgi:hypothetical protein
MKKILFACMLNMISLALMAQANMPIEYQIGTWQCNINPFHEVVFFEKYQYISHKKPVNIPWIKANSFNATQLTTPNSLIQAYTLATDNQWLSMLLENGRGNEKEELFSYRKKEEYKQYYNLAVLSEFYFTYESNDYCVVLFNYNNTPTSSQTLPFVCIKRDGKWKISGDKNLVEFSGYLFLKPSEFASLLISANCSNNQFLRKCFFDGVFRVDQMFFFTYLLGDSDKWSYHDIVIKQNDADIKTENINISSSNGGLRIGISRTWSKEFGALYTYSDTTSIYRNSSSSGRVIDFKSTSELALSSWIYSRNIEEKKSHTIGFDSQDEKRMLNQIDRIKNGQGNMKLLYKITFYDKKDFYTLIYFEDYIVESGNGSFKSYYYGDRRVLLKLINGVWKVDLAKNDYIDKLLKAIDSMSLDALQMLFKGILTGERSVDWYIKGNYLGWPDDGVININIIDEKRFVESELPKKLKRVKPLF